MGHRRGAYKVLVGIPEGQRQLGITRLRWKHNIKMDHQERNEGAWTGFIWLKIGTGGGRL
jgi:hypothetical protein